MYLSTLALYKMSCSKTMIYSTERGPDHHGKRETYVEPRVCIEDLAYTWMDLATFNQIVSLNLEEAKIETSKTLLHSD